jgi:nucleotide-binding universal stress UspA family protein
LVPLDESELAERALAHARNLIAPDGLLTLVSVVNAPDFVTSGLYPVPFEYQIENYETIRARRLAYAEDYIKHLAEKLRTAGVKVNYLLVVGEAPTCIVEQAEKLGVDAICMSTHGRSGISRWIFGSVTQKVLGAATCPVYVVPSREREKAENPQPEVEAQTL